MQKILVLRGGALGDFLVTLPALALLRDRWPAAEIDLVGNATAAQLGLHAGLLTHTFSQHDALWSALYNAAPLPAELHARLATYDLVVNYWPDPDTTLVKHFPLHSTQTFLTASPHPQTRAAAHFCAPLAALGLTSPNLAYTFRWAVRSARGGSESVVAPVADRGPLSPLATVIAIHPGSASPRKNWPADRWAQLADALATTTGAEIAIITGEAEPADLLAAHGTPWRNLPLLELARRLAICRLYLGHDTGISHLAATCGVPSLLLFGPTDPFIWAPPHEHVHVLQSGPDLASLSLSTVHQTAAHLFSST